MKQPLSSEVAGIPWMMYQPPLAELVRGFAPGPRLDGLGGESSADCEADRDLYRVVSHCAVIQVTGTLFNRRPWWADYFCLPVACYGDIVRAARAALADGNVRAIVLDVDSPGGAAAGCADAAGEIFAMRGTKPIVAIANAQMCSAALYLGTAADRVWTTRSALVGSLGVIFVRTDYSKLNEGLGIGVHFIQSGEAKSDGHPEKPFDGGEEDRLQVLTDELFNQFLADVAKFRGLDVEALRESAGDARLMVGAGAIAAGLADQVGTLAELIAELSRDPAPEPIEGDANNVEHEPVPDSNPRPSSRQRWGRRIETRAG